MSNDPFDFEADKLADQETDRDQDAMRLEELGNDESTVSVSPCHRGVHHEIVTDVEINFSLATNTPALELARVLSELSRRCLDLHRQDVERRETAAQGTKGEE